MDEIDYDRVCSKCKCSIWSEKHKDTIPSLHTCYHIKSEYYGKLQAWCSTCDKFEPKKEPVDGR